MWEWSGVMSIPEASGEESEGDEEDLIITIVEPSYPDGQEL